MSSLQVDFSDCTDPALVVNWDSKKASNFSILIQTGSQFEKFTVYTMALVIEMDLKQ